MRIKCLETSNLAVTQLSSPCSLNYDSSSVKLYFSLRDAGVCFFIPCEIVNKDSNFCRYPVAYFFSEVVYKGVTAACSGWKERGLKAIERDFIKCISVTIFVL